MSNSVYHAVFFAILFIANVSFSQEVAGDFSLVLKAGQSYHDCLQKQASQIDDGISDAQTIARLIAPDCEGRSLVHAKSLSDYDPKSKFVDVVAAVRRNSLDEATRQVLVYRRSVAKRLQE